MSRTRRRDQFGTFHRDGNPSFWMWVRQTPKAFRAEFNRKERRTARVALRDPCNHDQTPLDLIFRTKLPWYH